MPVKYGWNIPLVLLENFEKWVVKAEYRMRKELSSLPGLIWKISCNINCFR